MANKFGWDDMNDYRSQQMSPQDYEYQMMKMQALQQQQYRQPEPSQPEPEKPNKPKHMNQKLLLTKGA